MCCLSRASDGEWFGLFVTGSFIMTFSVLSTLISCHSRGIFHSLVEPQAGQALPSLHLSTPSEARTPNPVKSGPGSLLTVRIRMCIFNFYAAAVLRGYTCCAKAHLFSSQWLYFWLRRPSCSSYTSGKRFIGMKPVARIPPALSFSGFAAVLARQRGHRAGWGRQWLLRWCAERERDFGSSKRSESLWNGAVALKEHDSVILL